MKSPFPSISIVMISVRPEGLKEVSQNGKKLALLQGAHKHDVANGNKTAERR